MLFGAFDRHNLGDLLFPHILAKLLEPREVVFAGLAERNLTHWGGHRVRAIVEVASAWGEREANVIHVGGELLTCDAWEAAVMLLPPEEAGGVIGHLDGTPQRFAWARRYLGVEGRVPYCLPKSLFRHPGRFVFNGVGGVDLDRRDPVLREEVLAKLAAADEVGVRDRTTLGMLTRAGIATQLVPDPVARVAELFGDRIRERARRGEPAETGRAFPQGYIALQFSADFGDDATLAAIAAQLDRVTESSGLGVAFFRAGAAPWHDDPACYRAVAERMLSP
ncbi:MAG: chromosome condensation regulator RCC1, partial [Rhodocyclaceae bacterium]|nr:chromosome condensation regulator RCC1 [Rhodocyclaceae bacterium]